MCLENNNVKMAKKYYNAAFKINRALDSTFDGKLIITDGSSETTSDNIFEDGTMSVKFVIKNTGLGIGFV